MNYAGLKREFIQAVVNSGKADCSAAPDFIKSAVPQEIMDRWLRKFYGTKRPDKLPTQPRLINHFALGADPEFVLSVPGNGLINAEAIGLKAGLCVGADNNGRLVELRPQPSRFALEVLASLLEELRWAALMMPGDKVTTLHWKAGAWSGNDGLGGHIHFGRKAEKLRPFEVEALDHLSAALMLGGIFDRDEQRRRREGPGGYGGYGNIRKQSHGYEYRTLPSWLVSPWVAYLCITLAKLAVRDPHLIRRLFRGIFDRSSISEVEVRAKLLNILATYKTLDDDALYASIGLNVWGLPFVEKWPDDFKPAWGIKLPLKTFMPFPMPNLLPQFIKPCRATMEELFEHICTGRALTMKWPEPPTWPGAYTEKGFAPLQQKMHTRVAPGLGEMFWDLVMPREIKLSPHYENSDKPFMQIGDQWGGVAVDVHGIVKALNEQNTRVKVSCGMGHEAVVVSKAALARPYTQETRHLLLCGVLPIIHATAVRQFDFKTWLDRWGVKKNTKTASVKLYEG